MAWSNIEIQSAELVQDMSYEVLVEKLLEKYRKEGMKGTYEEVLHFFSIAMRSVENCANNISAIILECEESFNIFVGALISFVDLLDSHFGYSILRGTVLGRIEQMDNITDIDKINRIMLSCEDIIREEIENLMFWGNEESVKKAEQLSYYVGTEDNRSVFKVFMDYVMKILQIIDEKIKFHYGRSDKGMFYRVASSCISYHANVMNDKKYVGTAFMKQRVSQMVDTIYFHSREDIAEHPFVYALNKILNN